VDELAPNATCRTLAVPGLKAVLLACMLHGRTLAAFAQKETGCSESSPQDVTSDCGGPTSRLSIAEAECIHQKCRHLMERLVMAAVEGIAPNMKIHSSVHAYDSRTHSPM